MDGELVRCALSARSVLCVVAFAVLFIHLAHCNIFLSLSIALHAASRICVRPGIRMNCDFPVVGHWRAEEIKAEGNSQTSCYGEKFENAH